MNLNIDCLSVVWKYMDYETRIMLNSVLYPCERFSQKFPKGDAYEHDKNCGVNNIKHMLERMTELRGVPLKSCHAIKLFKTLLHKHRCLLGSTKFYSVVKRKAAEIVQNYADGLIDHPELFKICNELLVNDYMTIVIEA